MNRRFQILSIIFAAILIVVILSVQPARALSATDPDWMAIETTLRTYMEIKDEATFTLNDSRLVDVLANDPRGGLVDPMYLNSVRVMKGNPDLQIEEIGWLDVEQARFAFDRKVKQLYEDAVASGAVVAPTPPPYNPYENPVGIDIRGMDKDPNMHFHPQARIVPEVRALEQATGLGAGLPIPKPENFIPTACKILSISVKDDLAYAQVDWYYGLYEDVFAQKDSRWYLIGHHLIKWQGGG